LGFQVLFVVLTNPSRYNDSETRSKFLQSPLHRFSSYSHLFNQASLSFTYSHRILTSSTKFLLQVYVSGSSLSFTSSPLHLFIKLVSCPIKVSLFFSILLVSCLFCSSSFFICSSCFLLLVHTSILHLFLLLVFFYSDSVSLFCSFFFLFSLFF
jgi:hypothetical protein